MIFGYAKLSGRPDPESIDRIRQDLIEAGAETVYVDTEARWQAAGPAQPPHGLEAALSAIASGDMLITLTPAQLADSVSELIAIADRLAAKGATLQVARIAANRMLDTGTAEGRMMLGTLGILAAFDRPFGLPVQANGTGAASIFGSVGATGPLLMAESFAPRRPRGRPPTASTQAQEISRLRSAGMRATDIADRLKICRASVYRVLNLGVQETAMPQTSGEMAQVER